MKRILFILMTILFFISCTENQMARKFGGTAEIKLPRGEKLLMVTWKETNLFNITEPMDSDYIPKTKIFREDSNFGLIESKVIFIESR